MSNSMQALLGVLFIVMGVAGWTLRAMYEDWRNRKLVRDLERRMADPEPLFAPAPLIDFELCTDCVQKVIAWGDPPAPSATEANEKFIAACPDFCAPCDAKLRAGGIEPYMGPRLAAE